MNILFYYFMQKSFRNILFRTSHFIIILTLMVGCNFPTAQEHSSTLPHFTPSENIQQRLITFRMAVLQPLLEGDSVYISILDEVTGLAFNPHKYIMHAEDAITYSITLPFDIGTVVKYRYSREGIAVVNEYLYNGRPVRYRLYHVEGSATLQDVVTCWADTDYLGLLGRIKGQIVDISNGNPIPNVLVTAGGEQAFSLADGTFLLEGLPPATHNLVFYSLDGSYQIYQQGAVIAGDSTTPVKVQLQQAKQVAVIFTIEVPKDTPVNVPIRLAGNLYQLGNTYADLSGGVSTLASRMPSLGILPDGRYMLAINLPIGTYIEYKYTLGDGLWSSEMTSKGDFQLRHLIIPATNLEQNDIIEEWQTNNSNPVQFEVKVPSDTPPDEGVSIQFNPGIGWLEPLPMWPATNTKGEWVWRFDLTGPFNHLTNIKYRYCRQEQCGSADDEATMGVNPVGREFNPSTNPDIIKDEVLHWAWLSSPDTPADLPDIKVAPRKSDFVAGISFQSNYHPSWGPKISRAINNINTLEVNWLILTPTWTFTSDSPPILEPLPSQDMLWPDLINSISIAEHQGLSVGLFPVPNFPTQVDLWWQNSSRDFPWWVSFYEWYSNFILHHASVASITNAGSLILGGDWVNPALPDGLLEDGSASNIPADSELRWRNLINQIRGRYNGTLVWALSYPDGVRNPPPFLDAVDQIYILWSAPLASQPDTSADEMKAQARSILIQEILPFQQQIGKPIIIAISYPSIDIGAMGCIAIEGGGCLNYNQLNQPIPDISELGLNLQVQSDAYSAVLSSINDNAWISGFISMGYYPAVILQDKSTSIHGKPASQVVWYWTQNFLGR
jgi:hypothetical protein